MLLMIAHQCKDASWLENIYATYCFSYLLANHDRTSFNEPKQFIDHEWVINCVPKVGSTHILKDACLSITIFL